jgi:hypothetical protein
VFNNDMQPSPVVHQFDRWYHLATMLEWQLILIKQQANNNIVKIVEKP